MTRERETARIDLHLHSTASDGLKTPSELCKMALKLGLSAIALCDHDTLDGLEELEEAARGAGEGFAAVASGTADNIGMASQAQACPDYSALACLCDEGSSRVGAGLSNAQARAVSSGASMNIGAAKQTQVSSKPPLIAIGGIELSAGKDGHVHLLGYAPRKNDPELCGYLAFAARDRRERAERMLERLLALGVDLSAERKTLLDNKQVGRAHIARAMVRTGYAGSVNQAFERYLSEGRPAYEPRNTLSLTDAVTLLKGAGAVVSLAHPYRLDLDETAIAALVSELRGFGLDAVEAYHPTATRGKASILERMARRMGLLVTGGSDYHGDGGVRSRMGRLPESWASAEGDLAALIRAIAERR